MNYPEKYKGKKIVVYYQYLDAQRKLAYLICRTEDKEFPIFHWGDQRRWKLGAPPINIPYRLPELMQIPHDQIVWIVEGEKDVETLMSVGLPATCNRGGANASNAYKQWAEYFQRRTVCILPDNDKPGIKHAKAVQSILRSFDCDARILHLPGLGVKGDVTDWLTTGLGDKGILCRLTQEAFDKPCYDEDLILPDLLSQAGPTADAVSHPNEPNEKYDPTWRPFPVDQLPPEMRDYISEVARMLSCDPAYVVCSVIVAIGSAIGNSRLCQLNDEWFEPSVFWGCLVAGNSTLKSAACEKGAWPVTDLDNEFGIENQEAKDDYDAEVETWKSNTKTKRSGDDDDAYKPMPKTPVERRNMIEDITVEKLAQLLSANPKGLALICDELAGWFGSFTRYKSAGMSGTDLPFWLKVFRASGHTVDRKSGDKSSIKVARSGICVTGTTQHETIAMLLSAEFFSSGFVARILWAMPPTAKKVFIEGGIEPGVKDAYRRLYRNLYFIDAGGAFDAKQCGKAVKLTKAGLAAWKAFHKEWAEFQYCSFGEIGSALAKLEAYCARFALMFALCDFVQGRQACEEIDAIHVARAFTVVKWFADEANRVYAMVKTPLLLIEREKLLAWIGDQANGVTARDLFRSNPSRWGEVDKARKKLDDLCTDGFLKQEEMPPSSNGGRGFTKYLCLV